MAIPRFAIIAAAGAVLLFAAFLLTRGSSEAEEPAPEPPAVSRTPVPEPSSGAAPTATAAKSPSGARERSGARGRTGGEDKSARARRESGSSSTRQTGVPSRVRRALARRKVVVLFFTQRLSADDVATRIAFRRLRRRRDTAVFAAPLERLERYGAAVSRLGVSQSPSIVIIGRNRKARLIEGYVDPGSLRQYVADARKPR
jgi:hypothetical protein